MKITVLCDDQTKNISHLLAEHGFSLFIDAEKKILFDTGYSDVFLSNAKKLGIDLSKIDIVILSHGHWDHTFGLKHLGKVPILAHPSAFVKRYRMDGTPIGAPYSLDEMKKRFEVKLSKEPVFITPDIAFLGEIPRKNDFEGKKTVGLVENGKDKVPDPVIDDSGIAIRTSKGLIVISGCAHAGICNTIEHAKHVFNEIRIDTVIGGFHLLDDEKTSAEAKTQMKKTIAYFKKNKIPHILPCHCTGLPALSRLYDEFGVERVTSGSWV